jgi:integrase
VLAHAVDPLGKISSNPCEGIKQLYTVDRSEKIWTDVDIARLKAACSSPEIAHAVDLAAYTGLRLGDLLKLSWSHIGEDAIIIATGKSRGRREAIIPLYPDLRDVLARIPKRSTTIITNKQGRPWRKGFGSSFSRVKKLAGLDELHFHDLRGTAATRFYTAGLTERVIAEIMGWEEEHVGKIIRRYVGRAAATRDIIRQLERRT